MQFMDNHTRGDKLKRYRATVQLGADYSQFTDAIPGNGVALGTVTIRDHSGALVYLHDIGFIMITPNRVHRLNDHRIRGAIVQVQQEQPLDLTTCSAEVRDIIENAQRINADWKTQKTATLQSQKKQKPRQD
ncbi:MAG: hypothetical protein EKK69_11635 [Candidatus Competibacteraceae bacterium]|nr:MAG: hypothetical protein EKK69_11635 [Candidatus Competibacteraceae bacterium]